MKKLTFTQLAQYIDYTKLKADTTESDIAALISEAIEHKVKGICINPYWVKMAKKKLKKSKVLLVTVIGFPLGANSTESKVKEAIQAIKDGADELDMVLNIGAVKSGHWRDVASEIKKLAKLCHSQNKSLKVILETCLLTEEEKIKVCQICVDSQADFVKTSTGFSTGGATVADIKLMKSVVGKDCEIKASGGVKTLEQALSMIEAGATRIGTSSISFLKGSPDSESTSSGY